jgi:CHAT domain-containing protein
LLHPYLETNQRLQVKFRGSTKPRSNFAWLPILILAAAPYIVHGQASGDPAELQRSAIVKIDHWLGHVRTTGDATSTLSELAYAEAELRLSITLFAQRQDVANATWSAIKLGDIQRHENQFPQAVTTYQKTAQLAAMAKRPDYQTKALTELASTEMRLGLLDSAAGHIREAMNLGADCGNLAFYFDALDVGGEIEAKRGNLVAAADYLNRALAMSSQVNDRSLLYMAYLDRGDVYFQNAHKCDIKRSYDVCARLVELARADYLKAQNIAKEQGYSYMAATAGSLLQDADVLTAATQQSQNQNQKLVQMSMFNPKRPQDVLVSEDFEQPDMDPENLAMVENAVGQLRDWIARMQKQGLAVQDLNPSDLFIQGSLAQMKGDSNGALTKYLQTVQLLEQDRRKLGDEQSRSAFMEDKITYYNYPALILLQQKRYPEAFALFEQSRSRAMADILANRSLTLGTAQEKTLYSELQSQRAAIAALQEKLFNLTGSSNRDQQGKQIVELENQITTAQQQYKTIEARIATEAPKLNGLTSSKSVTLDAVQREATEDGFDLLYYVVLDTNLLIWHINGTEVTVKKVFLPHTVLSAKAASLRDSLVAPRDSSGAHFDEDLARQLYLFLIQPVKGHFKSHHLMVIPGEELTSIPFQVLLNPEDGKYAGETFDISYAPSATVLAAIGKSPSLKSGNLLAVADPAIHDASEEVRSIGALYPGHAKVEAQKEASKEDIGAWVSNYNLVHLSVHGKFNVSDPLLSYLQFKSTPSDAGHLTAAEMFGLPLKKDSLVVLSACETGRSTASHAGELVGMVRSLLYAGAANLVLSSWEVNAASTKLWMDTFYREGQTKEPAEAARLALIAVKSQPEFNHPFFWAPFLMTGK